MGLLITHVLYHEKGLRKNTYKSAGSIDSSFESVFLLVIVGISLDPGLVAGDNSVNSIKTNVFYSKIK